MKKKFLCLLLGALMLVSLLTSCSSAADSNELVEQTRLTQTLVMFLMCEEEVPEQTEYDIEDAINKITKAKFKTQLDLRFYTEENYYSELEKVIKAKEKEIKDKEKEEKQKRKWEKEMRESYKQMGLTWVAETTRAPETVQTEEETIVDPVYGIISYKYPEPEANQVDIFYLGGYDTYTKFVNEEWLARLNDEVNTSSKKLKEHMPEIYFNNMQDGGIFGIPTNSLVDEYTWMLLNKELMEDYFFTADSISSLTDEDLYSFLSNVYKYERDENNELKVLPVKGEIEPVNMYYWSYFDEETNMFTNRKSILGAAFNFNAGLGADITANSIFAIPSYVEQITAIKKFEFEGFHGTAADQNKTFAMSVMKGGYEIYQEYSDEYYVKMIEAPRADYDDVFSNMFCVNALEDNVARSMEIVTYIYTNETARNIIQYGVEGENYYIDDKDVLHRYNKSYMMDVNKTGNVFMAHPEEGLPGDYWNNGIIQNNDALIVPHFGFQIDLEEMDNLDTEKWKKADALTDSYMKRLDECKNMEELEAFLTAAKAELAKNEYVRFTRLTTDPTTDQDDTNDNDKMSIMGYYFKWRVDQGYQKVE